MLNFFKKLISSTYSISKQEAIPKPDIPQLVQRIQSKEEKSDIEPGRRIHEFELGTYTLRLDCDITKNYRITVSLGNERIYSFTVFAEQHDYEKLEAAYSMIVDFLMTEQSLQKLPNNDLLKGFYFGSRSS